MFWRRPQGRRTRDDGARRAIDERWLARAAHALQVEKLEALPLRDAPKTLALLARAERRAGEPLLVALSPHSGLDATLGALVALAKLEGDDARAGDGTARARDNDAARTSDADARANENAASRARTSNAAAARPGDAAATRARTSEDSASRARANKNPATRARPGEDAARASDAAAGGERAPLEVAVLSPVWRPACRRLLAAVTARARLRPHALFGAAPLPPVAPAPPLFAPAQLDAQFADAHTRTRFQDARRVLAGLVERHGGALRGSGGALEVVQAGAAVAQVRAVAERPVLEVLQPRSTRFALDESGAAGEARRAEAFSRVETQLRRGPRARGFFGRFGARGESAARARLLTPLAAKLGLRDVRRWPAGGDARALDAVAQSARGEIVLAAARAQLGLTEFADILHAASAIEPQLGVVLTGAQPPLQPGTPPRLVLAAQKISDGVRAALARVDLPVTLFEADSLNGPLREVRVSVARAGDGARTARRHERSAASSPAQRSRSGAGAREDAARAGGGARASEISSRANAPRDEGADEAGARRRPRRRGGRRRAGRHTRGENAERDERRENFERDERRESSGYDAGDERRENSERGERGRRENFERDGRGERSENFRRGERDERRENSERDGRGRRENFERDARGGRRESSERDERRESFGRDGRGERSERDEQGLRNESDARSERGESFGRDGRGDRHHRRGRRGERDESAARADLGAGEFEEFSLFELDDDENESARANRPDAARGRRRQRAGARDEDAAPTRANLAPSVGDAGANKKTGAAGDAGENTDTDATTAANTNANADANATTPAPVESKLDRLQRERSERRDAHAANVELDDTAAANANADAPPEPEFVLPKGRAAILAHADRASLCAALLLAREVRQVAGIWVYPQDELMTFFRGVTVDLRANNPLYVVGFAARPARDALQTAALYSGRLLWFDHHAWPPEDLGELERALGAGFVHVRPNAHSTLPLVAAFCTRRSRFSDKLLDLVTGQFSAHDFQRWGHQWWRRLGELCTRRGDVLRELEPLLAGRPGELAEAAARAPTPPPPAELAWVAARDARLVHFGSLSLVRLETPAQLDVFLTARIARERYGAALSLTRTDGEDVFVLGAGAEPAPVNARGSRSEARHALDTAGMVAHLGEKFAWVDALPGDDHVARFRIRSADEAELEACVEEVIAEIGMGRSILES